MTIVKNKLTFFCHLCSATRHDLVRWKEGFGCCSRCTRQGKFKCYHHTVCDSTTVNRLILDLENTPDEYLQLHGKHYEEILSKTKLNYDHTVAMQHTLDTRIDYGIPEDNRQKADQYAASIAGVQVARYLTKYG